MATKDLDKLHAERVNTLLKRFNQTGQIQHSELFTSERVLNTVDKEKIVLNGFKLDEVRAVLPFTPIVYAPICRACVKAKDLDAFKSFVQAGLIIPVLVGSYKYYDEALRQFLISHDHISHHEYRAYRYWCEASKGGALMCSHCLRKRFDEACEGLGKGEEDRSFKQSLDWLISNLQPFPTSDKEFIDSAFKAFQDRQLPKLKKLRELSCVIDQVRVDEAFHSPVLLKDEDLAALPTNLSESVDEAQIKTAALRKTVADGLGISIPTDIPNEKYIELVKDYQPRISATIDSVLAGGGAEASILSVSKTIMEVNRELERVQGLRRYAVLEASIGFFRNNKAIAAAALLSGGLGLAGSLAGCVATGGAAAVAGIAKKTGHLKWSAKPNKATQRLKRMVARDLQPVVDLFLSKYLGAKSPAINVLSLQKRILSEKESSRKS